MQSVRVPSVCRVSESARHSESPANPFHGLAGAPCTPLLAPHKRRCRGPLWCRRATPSADVMRRLRWAPMYDHNDLHVFHHPCAYESTACPHACATAPGTRWRNRRFERASPSRVPCTPRPASCVPRASWSYQDQCRYVPWIRSSMTARGPPRTRNGPPRTRNPPHCVFLSHSSPLT